jgi:putative ABC transport system permease protein
MKFFPLIWANLTRRKVRTLFTLLSVLVAFVLFGILGAVRQAFEGGVDLAGADRLVTMNKISLINPMPINYADRIAAIPGVAEVSWQEWVGGYYQDPKQPIIAFGVGAQSYLDIHPEMKLPADQQQTWLKDKRGAIIGQTLARQYHWKVGEHIPLRSNIWRDKQGNSTWDVVIDGVYSMSNGGQDNMLLMHYTYLDDARAFRNDTVGMFILKIADPAHSAQIAEQVDRLFANSPNETKTSTEKAFVQSFAAQFGDIGKIVTGIVAAVFFSMLLVTANTMAQSIRERTSELAVLKALGFGNSGIAMMVLAEALLVTLLGGAIGLGTAWLLVQGLSTKLIAFLPGFFLPVTTLVLGVFCMLGMGLLAGALPAVQALKLQVATALRRA